MFIENILAWSNGSTYGVSSIGIRFKEIDDKSLITFYKDGTASLNFGNIPNEDDKNRLKELVEKNLPDIWKQSKFQKDNLFNTYPSLSAKDIATYKEQLKIVFQEFLKK